MQLLLQVNHQLTMLDNKQSSISMFDNCNYFETIGTKEMSAEKALVETFYFEVWNKRVLLKLRKSCRKTLRLEVLLEI